jgi:hypothetical protein
MTHRQLRECRIQPRGLLRSSDGLRTPGMCEVTMSPLSFQPCIVNHWHMRNRCRGDRSRRHKAIRQGESDTKNYVCPVEWRVLQDVQQDQPRQCEAYPQPKAVGEWRTPSPTHVWVGCPNHEISVNGRCSFPRKSSIMIVFGAHQRR